MKKHVNDERWKFTGIHLKFVYLVKLLGNRYATSSPKNFENANNFEGRGLTLIAYKQSVLRIPYEEMMCE